MAVLHGKYEIQTISWKRDVHQLLRLELYWEQNDPGRTETEQYTVLFQACVS